MKKVALLCLMAWSVFACQNADKQTTPTTNATADTTKVADNPTAPGGLQDDTKLEAPANAQKAERVDFVKEDSNHLVWEQKVPANGRKDFVFAAKKGQKLTLGFIDDTNKGSMDLGKYSIEPNTDAPFEMNIEVSKEYGFTVSNNSNKATSFRIFISLE